MKNSIEELLKMREVLGNKLRYYTMSNDELMIDKINERLYIVTERLLELEFDEEINKKNRKGNK